MSAHPARRELLLFDSGSMSMSWIVRSMRFPRKPYGECPDSSELVDVVGLNSGVEAIGSGENHTCAILDTTEIMCWGRNNYGELGNGESGSNSLVPVYVLASGDQ